jgi:hypothetical protein
MQSSKPAIDPFVQLDKLIPQVSDLYAAIRSVEPKAHSLMEDLIKQIYRITDARPNATLAAIHLSRQQSPIKQAVYSAAITHLLSQTHGIEGATKVSLMRAVLTCNITFYEFQVLLNSMDGKLTEAQRSKLQRHPLQSALLLEKAGFQDPVMTKAIRQHHERIEGGGYPNNLQGDEISTLALIIGICETYTARIDNRAYRKQIHPREALAHLFKEEDPRIKKLMLSFAKSIGIYPPGTWVQLANREIAMVTAVQRQSPTPKVKALFDPQGTPYLGAIERDASQPASKVIGGVMPPCQPSVDLTVMFD